MSAQPFAAVLSITENRSRIMAVIVAMVRDFDLAEELFQETVIEILKSEDQFDPGRSFVPWACGIAKNVVRQHWRRLQNAPSNGIQEMIADLAMISAESDSDLWRLERKALRTCIRRLPERMQKLLVLRYGHNIKGDRLAMGSGVRRGSIRTTLSRLRSQLRQCIRAQTAQA